MTTNLREPRQALTCRPIELPPNVAEQLQLCPITPRANKNNKWRLQVASTGTIESLLSQRPQSCWRIKMDPLSDLLAKFCPRVSPPPL